MADFSDEEGVDHAMKVFGTPHNKLRRRRLRGEEDGEIAGEGDTATDGEVDDGRQPTPQPQREERPSKMDRIVSLIFHLAAAFFLVYMKLETDQTLARIKEEKGLIIPESDTFGGRAKFFTYLNYNMQICYFVLALLCDLLHTGQEELRKFRDFIFSTTVFPAGLLVTSIFWVSVTYLREYTVGQPGEPLDLMLNTLPPQITHATHTAVSFLVVIEALLVYHRYTSHSDAVKAILLWHAAYALWVHFCYYYAGTMPYPLFKTIAPHWMPVALLISLAVSIPSYFLGKVVTSWSWAGEVN